MKKKKLRLSSEGQTIVTRDDSLLCAISVLCLVTIYVVVVVSSAVLRGVSEFSMQVGMLLIGTLNAAAVYGYYESE